MEIPDQQTNITLTCYSNVQQSHEAVAHDYCETASCFGFTWLWWHAI